MLKLTKATVSK